MMLTDRPVIEYMTTAPDEVSDAVKCWNAGHAELFDFACLANSIVGKRDGGTERLAKRIHREVDTVERYAAAGFLWLEMLKVYPSDSELLRDYLDVSFWSIVGAKHKAGMFDISDAKSWLEEAKANNMTTEKLRSLMPVKRAGESTFTRAAKRIVGILEKDILNAPALDANMSDHERKVFINVSKWIVKFIRSKYMEAE